MQGRKDSRAAVTMKDIARETGFSINTVSHALRDMPDITEETKAKIRAKAASLGYVENSIAKSMRLGYTKTIAVILGDISNPHFAILMREIEAAASKEGYAVFLLNTSEDEAQEEIAIRTAIQRGADGIIICPVQKSGQNILFLRETGIPFVLIGRYFPDIDTPYSICDDVQGGYIATDYLIRKGHRRILMLSGPEYISSARERLEGYMKALEDNGIGYDENLVKLVPIINASCCSALSTLSPDEYSAVFAFSDVVAWDAWRCFRAMGRRVPEDVSLIGFDHIQSRLSLPYALTSVSTYKARMSLTSVSILLSVIKGENDELKRVIATDIAEGETVSEI